MLAVAQEGHRHGARLQDMTGASNIWEWHALDAALCDERSITCRSDHEARAGVEPGEEGVRQVLQMIRAEIERTMILSGIRSVSELTAERVTRSPLRDYERA
jgi:FMN-dependent dehydrogenase